MAIGTADLQKLVKDLDEAQKLIARKQVIDREIQQDEKRLKALQAQIVEARDVLEKLNATAQKVREQAAHEQARFTAELRTHQAQCAEAMRATEQVHGAAMQKAKADLAAFLDRIGAEKRALENAVTQIAAKHAAYQKAIQDFRARIALLG